MFAVVSILLAVPAQAQTTADIAARDQLVADQEALLNVYRCMFDIDTEVVPGGCADGSPVFPALTPVPFSGNPSDADIAARDQLVADQEALLNVYRCMFDIDTEVVPGGCSSVPEPAIEPPVVGTRANTEIPVFYCAPDGQYTQDHLTGMVADLNLHVPAFYFRESSGLVGVHFTIGGIVSPSFDWENTTLGELFERDEDSVCDTSAVAAAGDNSQILIVIHIMTGGDTGGYARYKTGPARVSFYSWGGPYYHGFRRIVAHEIGHSLFDLQHTDEEEVREFDCIDVEWSLMNSSNRCRTRSRIDSLSFYQILCWQREILDWPCVDPPPAVPGDTPRSYGSWTSYENTDLDQMGVKAAASSTEGVSESNVPSLRMSCDHRDSDDEWGLFSYVGWDGDVVLGDADGDMRAEAIFANGEVLSLTGYEGTDARFMNFHASSSFRLFNAVLQHEGVPVTISATDRDGKVYTATFDTDGASIAVRSVLNFCAIKMPDPAQASEPVSSGVWRSYDSTNFAQLGVLTAAYLTEGVSDNNVPRLRMPCDLKESRGQWGLFSYVGWDGDTVRGDADGDMTAEARFVNGDVVSLNGYEGTDARFMNFNAANSARLFNAVLEHEGMPLTLSTTDREGRLYTATFSTDGAALALRSVMDYCNRQ
ncbi:hypothetical protein [Candidatus Poriferisocius sp.]|uniref:hypothetical protein n=1 Tax=Candidatus Poriferisocius sp. TaxID=3101276 RepID=UPI003B01977B